MRERPLGVLFLGGSEDSAERAEDDLEKPGERLRVVLVEPEVCRAVASGGAHHTDDLAPVSRSRVLRIRRSARC